MVHKSSCQILNLKRKGHARLCRLNNRCRVRNNVSWDEGEVFNFTIYLCIISLVGGRSQRASCMLLHFLHRTRRVYRLLTFALYIHLPFYLPIMCKIHLLYNYNILLLYYSFCHNCLVGFYYW